MSSEQPAIQVEGVGKRYRYGAGPEGRLAEALQRWMRRLVRRGEAPSRESFWALRDVSLDIHRGEVVGIIGRNGAGKSTLLKLLSNITLPTEGRIVMRGRVASLLEVGAGFDPELSGRENVFLSGAVLGMRRREIDEKFDEIVAFAGVQQFIDTPVKRYSSGMFVRLAFAVGAHLESDILLVDEVLAVGDAEFQRKCLAKMQDIAREGRAVVFVSHNMAAVRRLCDRAYLLRAGRIAAAGTPSAVIADHLRDSAPESRDGVAVIGDDVQRSGSGHALLRSIRLVDSQEHTSDRLHLAEPFSIVLEYDVLEHLTAAILEIGVVTGDGYYIANAMSTDGGRQPEPLEPGSWTFRVDLDLAMLPGSFAVNAMMHLEGGQTLDAVEGALQFSVGEGSRDGGETFPWPNVRGSVRPRSTWTRSSGAAPSAGEPELGRAYP